MLLEKVKFLEEAVGTTLDEILEEAELILEGSNPEDSAKQIISIIAELRKTMKNPETILFDTDFDISEESTETQECDNIHSRYPIGHLIKVKSGRCPYDPDPELFKVTSYEEDDPRFGSSRDTLYVKNGQIVSKFYIPESFHSDFSGEVGYVIENESKLYFIPENALW